MTGSYPDPILPRLVGIYEICGTAFAFAALKHDGTVLTWGHPVAWRMLFFHERIGFLKP